MFYDVIGDVHGHADALVRLLKKMDYVTVSGVWRHPERMAIFVGDFIDLGPKQVETVRIAKRMVESGAALAVLGNHDLNAIAWFLRDPDNPEEYLRPHFDKQWGANNRHQHAAFLAEVENDPELHTYIIEWFLTLPLWLDLPELRVVHACWHSRFIEFLTPVLRPGGRLDKDLMNHAAREGRNADLSLPSVFRAVEAITKGMEIPLPEGSSFHDKYGIPRTRVRTRWWDETATTYQSAALLDASLREQLTGADLPPNSRVFQATEIPVFIGHYWLKGTPLPLTDKIACVDYSVGAGGPLCAYRWSGEVNLHQQNFCCVDPD